MEADFGFSRTRQEVQGSLALQVLSLDEGARGVGTGKFKLPVPNVPPLAQLKAKFIEMRHWLKSQGFVQSNAGGIREGYTADHVNHALIP